MRVAALYDIHGNLPALEATLAEVEALGCERILVGGDVALGPMPRETVELLMARGDRVQWIRGNCDRDMAASGENAPDPKHPWGERIRWAWEQLAPPQRALLAGLPLTAEIEIEGLGRVLFCHATPRSDEEIVTRLSPESRLTALLADTRADVVVSGHTHVQFDRAVAGRRWINAGSVGLPFEGEMGAYWALLGPDARHMRTAYDVERAASMIGASGFPNGEEFARKDLLTPDSAAAASERFEQWAVAQQRAAELRQEGVR